MLLFTLSMALAAPTPSDQVQTFAAALAAQGDFVVPAGGVPPPSGSGSNKLDVYSYGNLVILKDPDGEWFSEATTHALQGDVNWVMSSATGAFYKHYGDDYDFVSILMVRDLGMFFAFYQPLSNDVYGIGYDSVTPGEVFDQSNNKLQGYIFMNYYGLWSEDPEVGRFVFGQEFMHRWGAFVNLDAEGPDGALDPNVLLGRDIAHWSYWFQTTNSPMEGNAWIDNGDGTYTVDLGATSTYSDLDLYLMGLVGPDEVGAQSVLLVDADEQARVAREPASPPEAFDEAYAEGSGEAVTVAGTKVDFTVDDIISAEGERIPSSADSPRSFRMAFLVIVLSDDEPDGALLDDVDTVRQTFEADWEADVRGLADLDTTLGAGDAPTWGAAADTADSAVDSASDPDGDPETEEQAGCGCAAAPSPNLAFGLVALALALVSRSRK